MKHIILIGLFASLCYSTNAQNKDMTEATVLSMNKPDLVDRIAEFTIQTTAQSWAEFKAGFGLTQSMHLTVPNSTLPSGFKPSKDLQFKKLKLSDSNGNSLSLMDARVIGLKNEGNATIWKLKYKSMK